MFSLEHEQHCAADRCQPAHNTDMCLTCPFALERIPNMSDAGSAIPQCALQQPSQHQSNIDVDAYEAVRTSKWYAQGGREKGYDGSTYGHRLLANMQSRPHAANRLP